MSYHCSQPSTYHGEGSDLSTSLGGLACTQAIFQWMMDQILTCCDGVIGIADDVVVHGKDERNMTNVSTNS